MQLVDIIAGIALNMSRKLRFLLISGLLSVVIIAYFCAIELQFSVAWNVTFIMLGLLPCLIFLPFFLLFRSLTQLPQTLREIPPQLVSAKDSFAPLTTLKQPQKLGFFGLFRALWTLMSLKDSLSAVVKDSLAGWSGHYWSLMLITNPIALFILLLAGLLWLLIIIAVVLASIVFTLS